MSTNTTMMEKTEPDVFRNGACNDRLLQRYIGPIFVNGDFRLFLEHLRRDREAAFQKKLRNSEPYRLLLRSKFKEAENRRAEATTTQYFRMHLKELFDSGFSNTPRSLPIIEMPLMRRLRRADNQN